MKTRTVLALLLLAGAAACGERERASAGGATPADTAPVVDPASIRQPPQLANADSVRSVLAALYPPDLKARNIGGEVLLRMLVSQDGYPLAVEVQKSSGQPALDAAAQQVANTMRFEPARTDQGAAKVWVTFPVRWLPPSAAPDTTKTDTSPAPR
jgi:protein TonB